VKPLNFSSYNIQTKAYLGALAVFSLFALGTAVVSTLSFKVEQWLALGISSVVCLIISQYNIKIPRTNGFLSIKEIVIFWAFIWLGLGGAVILAAISAGAAYRNAPKNKNRWSANATSLISATFVSSILFYFILRYAFSFLDYPVGKHSINAFWLAGTLFLVGGFHCILQSALYAGFLKLEGMISVSGLWKNNYIWAIGGFILCAIAVFIFHLSMVYFGLLFGVLLLPVTILAHLSYRFHEQLLSQKTKEIREANRVHVATVEALATAIDARDQVGRGHVTRTQIYAIGIGKSLNLPPEEIQALSTGALLHDIGKLAVPDHILNKPGRLTPAEMEKMKIHPSVGAAILERVDFSYPVIPTVRYHHESWDGSGYPEGRKKEEIPLTARILAVADAYDTIRGARPYRPSVSKEEARRYLLNSAGTQFDPAVVDIFLRNLSKFEAEADEKQLSYEIDQKAESDSQEILEPRAKISYVEQIKRANREVFTLYELARVFSSALTLDDTLSLFVKKIQELVPLDTCVIYLLDETQNVAIAKHAVGKYHDDLKNRKIKVGQGATGYALKKRQSIYNINPGLDFSFYQMEFIQEYTSMASLPLIANEKLLGAVSLYSCELESYEDEHMRLMETLARIASDAISNSLRHAETESRALTDAMTELPNGRSLQIHFEKEIARAKRNGSNFQVLMLDLDGFKAINDTFGHKAGDKLLKDISVVMQEQLRDYDFLARYAGDEFVAIIPETDNKSVHELCQRMEKAVREYKLDVGEGRYASVGVSLGAAAYPNSGETLDQIIIAADKAMYAVKERRKSLSKKAKAEKERARKALIDARLAERKAKLEMAERPIIIEDVAIQPVEMGEIQVEPLEFGELDLESGEVTEIRVEPPQKEIPDLDLLERNSDPDIDLLELETPKPKAEPKPKAAPKPKTINSDSLIVELDETAVIPTDSVN